MTRTVKNVGLMLALVLTLGGPALSATTAWAEATPDEAASTYCSSVPDSLLAAVWSPAICS